MQTQKEGNYSSRMNPSAQPPVSPVNAKRRLYDEQFKSDAVALLEGGRSASTGSIELAVQLADMRRELEAVIRQQGLQVRITALINGGLRNYLYTSLINNPCPPTHGQHRSGPWTASPWARTDLPFSLI